jgi:hypothetical protein
MHVTRKQATIFYSVIRLNCNRLSTLSILCPGMWHRIIWYKLKAVSGVMLTLVMTCPKTTVVWKQRDLKLEETELEKF